MDELTFAKMLLSLIELTKGQCSRLPKSFTQYSKESAKERNLPNLPCNKVCKTLLLILQKIAKLNKHNPEASSISS
jgi:hypothetical protein